MKATVTNSFCRHLMRRWESIGNGNPIVAGLSIRDADSNENMILIDWRSGMIQGQGFPPKILVAYLYNFRIHENGFDWVGVALSIFHFCCHVNVSRHWLEGWLVWIFVHKWGVRKGLIAVFKNLFHIWAWPLLSKNALFLNLNLFFKVSHLCHNWLSLDKWITLKSKLFSKE